MCSPVHCACWLENASSHTSEDNKVWVAGGDTLCTQAVKLTSPTPKKLAINESLGVLMLAPARYAIIGREEPSKSSLIGRKNSGALEHHFLI